MSTDPDRKANRRVRVSAIPAEVADRIRRAYADGVRSADLVERFGLSRSTLMRVILEAPLPPVEPPKPRSDTEKGE